MCLSYQTKSSNVPLDAETCTHWDEAEFGAEMMTSLGTFRVIDPLSRMTIAVLDELGYSVDYSKADPYALPGSGLSPQSLTYEFTDIVDMDFEYR